MTGIIRTTTRTTIIRGHSQGQCNKKDIGDKENNDEDNDEEKEDGNDNKDSGKDNNNN